MISQRDVEQYQEQGYLVVPDVLDAGILARMRGALDDLVAKASSVSEHTDVYDLEPGHTPQNPKVRRIKLPHTHTPVFWELANYRQLVGDPGAAAGPIRRASAWIQDQPEGAALRLTGGMAPGLGLLSPHQ